MQPKRCSWCSSFQGICLFFCILEFKRTNFTSCGQYKGIQQSVQAYLFVLQWKFVLALVLKGHVNFLSNAGDIKKFTTFFTTC